MFKFRCQKCKKHIKQDPYYQSVCECGGFIERIYAKTIADKAIARLIQATQHLKDYGDRR